MAKALNLRVLKATTLLGSTQLFGMLCSVVRIKLLSLWVWPLGVGLAGLFGQAQDMVGNLTQLNVRTSAVRDLAATADDERRRLMAGAVRRVSATLGLLGALIMLLGAPLISLWAFGSGEWTWCFRVLSLSVFCMAMQGGETVILQAEGRFKSIGAAGLATAVIGLAIAAPLFWFLRANGVVFSLLGYSAASWGVARWMTRGIRARSPGWRESWRMSAGFIRVGVFLTAGMILGDVIGFVTLAFMERQGDEVLSLYQAGYLMIWRYVGLLFASLSFEFYPRLSRACTSARRMGVLMSHESLLITAIYLPCASLAVALAPQIIRLLYSSNYLGVLPYFIWGMVGMAFRPLALVAAFGILSRARGFLYVLTEALSAAFGLLATIGGYYWWGFTGVGVGLIFWMMADVVVGLAACRLKGIACISWRVPAAVLAGALMLFVAVTPMALWDAWYVPLAATPVLAIPALRLLLGK